MHSNASTYPKAKWPFSVQALCEATADRQSLGQEQNGPQIENDFPLGKPLWWVV